MSRNVYIVKSTYISVRALYHCLRFGTLRPCIMTFPRHKEPLPSQPTSSHLRLANLAKITCSLLRNTRFDEERQVMPVSAKTFEHVMRSPPPSWDAGAHLGRRTRLTQVGNKDLGSLFSIVIPQSLLLSDSFFSKQKMQKSQVSI